ncbi:MAG TPA: hypothetical protein VF036_05875 [Actinomycetota bacterium]
MNARRDEAGVVGKMVVVWLLFLVVIAVAAIDAASIAFTTYKLSDVGSTAASEGALVFKADHDVRQTCARVAKVVTAQEPTAKVARGGCSVEAPTGLVTVKIQKLASTVLAHRISWTEDFAAVTVTETAGPPSL